jgi:hypothetical protein
MLTSDADGIVRLEHPTESVTYELKIRRSGFEMLTDTGIKLDGNKPPVIQLVKARPTTGVIVNADGRPVANAKVMLYGTDSPRKPHPQRQSPPEELAVTDATGYFTLDTLAAENRYSLDIQTENDGRHLIHGVRSGEVDRPIRLDPELVLEGTIAGDLDRLILKNSDIPYGSKEERDKLIGTHGFTCRLNETYGGMGHSVDVWVVSVTVDNGVGHFRIGNLIPATVALYGAGRRARVRVTEPVRGFVFNIDDGPTRDRKLVLQFNPPDGNVPPEGEVSVHIRGPRETTDQVIETLPIKNGRIEVDCYAPGRVYFIPQNIVGYWFNSAWVEIDGDTKALHHDVPLVPAGAISGVIRHADGRPASTKTNIGYGTIEHAPEMLHKSSLGDEVHPAADGKYFLSPVPLGGTYYVYAIEDRLLTVVGPVRVDASKPSASVDIVLPRGITIRGKVLDPEGRPLPGMKVGPGVSFFSLALGMSTVETYKSGEFTAGPINPDAGKNSITVGSRIDFQTAYLKIIDLSKPIIIRMERGLKASGVVLDEETGWPIPNAEVFAHPENGGGVFCEAESRTDNNGRFRFSNLPNKKMQFRIRGALHGSPGSVIISNPGDMDMTFRVKGTSRLKPRKPDYLP